MASMAFSRRGLVALGLALLLAACSRSAPDAPVGSLPPPPPADSHTVLVTAFEPFGGHATNASWEVVKRLEGQTIADHRVVTLRLPVVYDAVEAPLRASVDAHRPRVVVAFGLGRDRIHVERFARNGYHPKRPPDEAGRPPPRDVLVPGGAEAVQTTLPVAAILARLAAQKIGAEPSDDAGGYLCNECFYRLMALRGGAADAIRIRGFVHLPDLDAPDPAGGTYTLERLEAAVRAIVEESIAAARGP